MCEIALKPANYVDDGVLIYWYDEYAVLEENCQLKTMFSRDANKKGWVKK